MTADQISVNFGALQSSAGSLSAKAAALTNYLEELLRTLQPMKQTWVESNSSAGVAADQAETKLRQATNDIIATINLAGMDGVMDTRPQSAARRALRAAAADLSHQLGRNSTA